MTVKNGHQYKLGTYHTTALEDTDIVEISVSSKHIVPVVFLPNVMGSKLETASALADIKFPDSNDKKFKSIDDDRLLGWKKINAVYRDYLLKIEKALNDFSKKNSAEDRLRSVAPDFEISETVEELKKLMEEKNIKFEIWTIGYNWKEDIKEFSKEIVGYITGTIQAHYEKEDKVLHKSALEGDNVKVLLMSYGFSNLITNYLTTGERMKFEPENGKPKEGIIGQIHLNTKERWTWKNFIPSEMSCNALACCGHELWFQEKDFFALSKNFGHAKVAADLKASDAQKAFDAAPNDNNLETARNDAVYAASERAKDLKALKDINDACRNKMNMPDYYKTSMDNIQKLRTKLDTKMTFESEHRCYTRNATVSTPQSTHLWLAFDCHMFDQVTGTKRFDHGDFAIAAYGEEEYFGKMFKGFGFHRSFVHLDVRMNTGTGDEYSTIWPYSSGSLEVQEITKFVTYCDNHVPSIPWKGNDVIILLTKDGYKFKK